MNGKIKIYNNTSAILRYPYILKSRINSQSFYIWTFYFHKFLRSDNLISWLVVKRNNKGNVDCVSELQNVVNTKPSIELYQQNDLNKNLNPVPKYYLLNYFTYVD